jgi:hypothetical protein
LRNSGPSYIRKRERELNFSFSPACEGPSCPAPEPGDSESFADIAALHKELDDDADGDVDISETDDVSLRDV